MALRSFFRHYLPRHIARPALLWLLVAALITLATELTCIVGFQLYGDKVLRDALLATSEVGAATLDGRDLSRLAGLPSDVERPEFARARASLGVTRRAMRDSRFVYLLGERQGRIVFLADSTAPESRDYSAPGDPYAEASPALRQSFADGIAFVEGPISDRWGTWVSAVAPIRNPDDGRIVAVFGMDLDAGEWEAKIAGFRWFGTAIGGALVCLELLFAALVHRQRRLARKLRLANHIVESSSTIIYRVAAEPDYPLTFISDNVRTLGYEAGEILASPVIYHTLVHPEDRAQLGPFFRALAEGGNASAIQIRIRTRQGDYRWVEDRILPIRDAGGRLIAAEGTLTDITESRELENRIRFTNAVLATAMETSPDAIVVVDGNGRAISHNRRFLEMWDIPPETMDTGDDASMVALVSGAMKDPQAFATRVQYLHEHRTEIGHDELETRDGRFVERHTAPLTEEGGRYLGRVWFFRDVTAHKRAEAEIRHTAGHDALTGLPNRRLFLDAVTQAMGRAERGEKNFAVLFLDLDHFKDVNDTLGHPAGDELLRAVADRLGEVTRSTDMVSRFGGDEFAVLMTSMGEPADAAILAAKLIANIARPFSVYGSTVRTGVSIGIVVCEPDETDSEVLLSHADVALYGAKAEGRGGYRFFTDAMDVEVRNRVNVSTELREAIESNQLFLEYQPQVEVETGRIVGLEALVRWHHPTRGVIQPNDFVPIAEKSGLIGTLGQWVMTEACRQIKAWLAAGIVVPRVAVNVSALQFKMVLELEEAIARTLVAAGLPTQALEIELTETAIMEVSWEHGGVLQRMRKNGLKFAIDDFGTGYSSLDYLRRFPVDRLKIAQEFVKLISVDSGSAAIVRATIGLARELGMVAIAEGVESADQLRLLRSWGCSQVQGHYYAHPLGPNEIAVMLRRGVIVPAAAPPPALAAAG